MIKLPHYLIITLLLLISVGVTSLRSVNAGEATAPRVEVLVTAWCPYCQLLEQFLKSSNIPYVRKDIEKSTSARQLHEELGGGSIPVTRIDGKTVIRGFNPPAIVEALKQKPPQGQML